MADALLGGGTSGALAFQVLDAGVQWVDVVMVEALARGDGLRVRGVFGERQQRHRSRAAVGRALDDRWSVRRRGAPSLRRAVAFAFAAAGLSVGDRRLAQPAAQTANLQNNFANAMPAFTTAFTNGDVSARYALTTTSGTGANNKAWSPPLGNIGLWVADGGIFNYSGLGWGFDAIASFLGSFPARREHRLPHARRHRRTRAVDRDVDQRVGVVADADDQWRAGAPAALGIVCPDGVNCNDGTELNRQAGAAARGSNGLLGDVRTFTTTNSAVQSATAQRIANYVVDSVGFSISGGPMPASARVTHTPCRRRVSQLGPERAHQRLRHGRHRRHAPELLRHLSQRGRCGGGAVDDSRRSPSAARPGLLHAVPRQPLRRRRGRLRLQGARAPSAARPASKKCDAASCSLRAALKKK